MSQLKSLFYDQLLADSLLENKIRELLQSCVVIEATNVSNYYFESSDQEIWDVTKDFPNIAPPFSDFFLEFQAPLQIVSKESGTKNWSEDKGRPSAWGVYCTSKNWGAGLETNGMKIKWTLGALIFWKVKGSIQYHCPLWGFQIPIDANGKCAGSEKQPFIHYPMGIYIKRFAELLKSSNNINYCIELQMDAMRSFAPMFHTALLAISFMHCKNVKISEVVPPDPKPPTKKQIKYRHLPRQLATYHVLDIEPMRQILKSEGQSEKVGQIKSLHICRGHFAHYEDGKGLFGKYHGTYWIPQHVRGSANKGVAVKDYRIKAPHETKI